MTPNYTRASFGSFMIGYLLLYYVVLYLATIVFEETVKCSWTILGEYNVKMKIALVAVPLVGALFGTWAASISIMSYTVMGSDRLGPFRFFTIGWFSFLWTNMMTLSIALKFIVDEKIGQEWIQYLGNIRFNSCLFLLAPSFGFAGGVATQILSRKLIEAQRS